MLEILQMPESFSEEVQNLAVQRAAGIAEAMSGRSPREVILLKPRERVLGNVSHLLFVELVDPKSPVWRVTSNVRVGLPGILEIDREQLMDFLGFCTRLDTDRLTTGVTTVSTSPAGQTTMFTEKRGGWFGVQPVSRLLSGKHVMPRAICLADAEITQLRDLRWQSQAGTGSQIQVSGQARLF